MAAWKEQPKYKVQLLTASGSAVATSGVYVAAPNAGGNRIDVSKAMRRELPFTITEKGKYIIRFTNETTAAGGLDEFLLLDCRILKDGTTSLNNCQLSIVNSQSEQVYDLHGRRQQQVKRGLNIIRTADGRTIKVMK